MTGLTRTALYTAEVRAPDGVRFSARAEAPHDLSAQLVDYICSRCDDVLWPTDAQKVRSLIGDKKHEAAIAVYFERVGDRWDEEKLQLSALGARLWAHDELRSPTTNRLKQSKEHLAD